MYNCWCLWRGPFLLKGMRLASYTPVQLDVLLIVLCYSGNVIAFSDPSITAIRCIDIMAGESLEIDVTNGNGGYIYIKDCGVKAIPSDSETIMYMETDCTPYITVGETFKIYVLQSNSMVSVGDKLYDASCEHKTADTVTASVTVGKKTSVDAVSMDDVIPNLATLTILRQSDNAILTDSFVGEGARIRLELDPAFTRTALGGSDGFDIRAIDCGIFNIDGAGALIGPIVTIQSAGCAVPDLSSTFGTFIKVERGILERDFSMFRIPISSGPSLTRFKCTLATCFDDCQAELLTDCSDGLSPWGRKRRSSHGNGPVYDVSKVLTIYEAKEDVPVSKNCRDCYTMAILITAAVGVAIAVAVTIVTWIWCKSKRSHDHTHIRKHSPASLGPTCTNVSVIDPKTTV